MANPINSGPNHDGSRSLAKESRYGILVTTLLTIGGTGVLDWLSNLDTSTRQGWWARAGVLAVSAAGGLLTAWLKKNR